LLERSNVLRRCREPEFHVDIWIVFLDIILHSLHVSEIKLGVLIGPVSSHRNQNIILLLVIFLRELSDVINQHLRFIRSVIFSVFYVIYKRVYVIFSTAALASIWVHILIEAIRVVRAML